MLNENGSTRRERLHGNGIAEDVFVRCHVFLTSRLHTSHQLAGEMDNVCVTELSAKLNSLLQSFSSSSSSLSNPTPTSPTSPTSPTTSTSSDSYGLRITDISDSIVDQVLPMYASNLLLAEDASMAAAFLYVAHAMFPSFFDPVEPFSPVETLLINGNIVLPCWESTTATTTTTTTTTNTTLSTPSSSSSLSLSLKSSDEMTIDKPVEKPVVHETMPSSSSTSTSISTLIIPTEVRGLFGLADHPFEDRRPCYLCTMYGDNVEAGRMLCTPSGEWVHLNCIYYSQNTVSEKSPSTIIKCPTVKTQSNSNICYVCNKPGAFLQCGSPSCSQCFHFACGRRNGCMITLSRFSYCHHHNPKHRLRTTPSFSGPNSIASSRMRTTNPTTQNRSIYRNASSIANATNITNSPGNMMNSNRPPMLETPSILPPTSSGLSGGQSHSGEIIYSDLAIHSELVTTQFNHCLIIKPPNPYELIIIFSHP